jgi:hypothetical protein
MGMPKTFGWHAQNEVMGVGLLEMALCLSFSTIRRLAATTPFVSQGVPPIEYINKIIPLSKGNNTHHAHHYVLGVPPNQSSGRAAQIS